MKKIFKRLYWKIQELFTFRIYRELVDDGTYLHVFKFGLGCEFWFDSCCNSDLEFDLILFGFIRWHLAVNFVMSPERQHAAGMTGVNSLEIMS